MFSLTCYKPRSYINLSLNPSATCYYGRPTQFGSCGRSGPAQSDSGRGLSAKLTPLFELTSTVCCRSRSSISIVFSPP
jgi:hypothetical protein